MMIRRSLGAVACDPFWSSQNGLCSDSSGNYLTAGGDVVTTSQIMQTVNPKPVFNTPNVGALITTAVVGILLFRAVVR